MQKVDVQSNAGKNPQSTQPHSAKVESTLTHASVSPSRKLFQLRNTAGNSRLLAAGEGYQKLRARLISHGLPETVVGELIEHHTLVNYAKGAIIFFQGSPADLLFWVSSGLVDILCLEPGGNQTLASLLGPGEIFGFVEVTDRKGRAAQAFQARARTQVQLGLVTREHVCKVLSRLETPLLLHILEEITAAWGAFTHDWAQFLGMNYGERLETVFGELAKKFGVRESRGTLLIPEFGHADFAEMIGSSRPMVSRLIAEMIADGRLAHNGKHYIILDESAIKTAKL